MVEAWMPQEPLDLCGVEPNDNGDENNANRNSVLYNAMIHPLIRLSIKGALWYQGKKIYLNPFVFHRESRNKRLKCIVLEKAETDLGEFTMQEAGHFYSAVTPLCNGAGCGLRHKISDDTFN